MARQQPDHDDRNRPVDEEQERGAAANRRVLGVFAALLALVVIVLAGGVAFIRSSRPPAGPRPVISPQTAPVSATTIDIIPATTVPMAPSGPAITPTTTATPAPAPAPTTAPMVSPTGTVALRGSPGTPPPGATVRGSTVVLVPASPTAQRVAVVDPLDPRSPLIPELVTAYLHYWDVRAEAFRTLDPTRLPEVLAEPELGLDQARISRLQALDRAVQLRGDHSISIVRLTPDTAVLVDQFANRSIAIDPATGQEVPGLAPALQKLVFTLRKIDGTWKVVEVQQQ